MSVCSLSGANGTLMEVALSEVLAYHVVVPGGMGYYLRREIRDLSATQTATTTFG
ncbi:MAG: hypothetical protein ACP5RN_04405 [Armatimonadota bacterium]